MCDPQRPGRSSAVIKGETDDREPSNSRLMVYLGRASAFLVHYGIETHG